jgi:hypothetical protein
MTDLHFCSSVFSLSGCIVHLSFCNSNSLGCKLFIGQLQLCFFELQFTFLLLPFSNAELPIPFCHQKKPNDDQHFSIRHLQTSTAELHF